MLYLATNRMLYETSKLNKVQLCMHGTLNALVNNSLECAGYMPVGCKQRDAASFLFPILLRHFVQTMQLPC